MAPNRLQAALVLADGFLKSSIARKDPLQLAYVGSGELRASFPPPYSGGLRIDHGRVAQDCGTGARKRRAVVGGGRAGGAGLM
jgi:hypothetical protein